MSIGHFLLYFLACGGVTFPLTLFAVRFIASLSHRDLATPGELRTLATTIAAAA